MRELRQKTQLSYYITKEFIPFHFLPHLVTYFVQFVYCMTTSAIE